MHIAQMKCLNCKKPYDLNEIDDSGYCFVCANDDPYHNPDYTNQVKKLIEDTMNNLAVAKGVSPEKVKTDFVNEHVINKTTKKKPDGSAN